MESKFKRYIIYALGEVFLLVVGILLALSINQSAEVRNQKELQINYLNKLLIELKSDTAQFIHSLASAEQRVSQHFEAHEILNTDQVDDERLIEAVEMIYNQAMNYPSFSPRMTTYNEMVASGSLRIIKNDSLRNQIVDVYTAYELEMDRYRDFVNKKLDFEVTLWYDYEMLRHLNMTRDLYPEEPGNKTAAYIRTHKDKYLNHSAINVVIKNLIRRICYRSLNVSTDLITELENELEKLN